MKLETKYDVGNKVYYGYAEMSKKDVTCPLCLGEKTCEISFPNKETITHDCPLCLKWYIPQGVITEFEFVPSVKELTIALCRFYDDEPTYMCDETGYPSGTNYQESILFDNYNDAFAYAEKRVVEQKEHIIKANYDRKDNCLKSSMELLGYKQNEKRKKAKELKEVFEFIKKYQDMKELNK